MTVEQVFAEQDSEDEVDDDVADLEDRRVCLKIQYNCFHHTHTYILELYLRRFVYSNVKMDG